MMAAIREKRAGEKHKTEKSSPPRKRIKIWGSAKEDLNTTWISMRKDRNTFSEVVFVKVHFGVKSAYIQKDSRRLYHHLGCSDEAIEDMKTKLDPLNQTIEPLSHLKSLPPKIQDTWGSFEEYEHLPPGLSETLRTAFEDDMNDTSGKTALRDLITDIVKRLDLDRTLSVVSTGSASSMSRFATCIATNITDSSDSQSPEKTQKQVEVCTPHCPNKPVSIDAGLSTSSSSLSTASSFSKPKLCTADVVVYSSPAGKTGPIRAHLVVSVNKGQNVNQVDIINGLLSRLPYQYQFGTIYGLLINAHSAKFYSVEYENNDANAVVQVHVYEDHSFRSPDQHFDTKAFWKVIVDIALVLKNQSDVSDP